MAWWTTCSLEEGYTKVTQQTARQRQRGKKVELLLEECRCLCNLTVAETGKELFARLLLYNVIPGLFLLSQHHLFIFYHPSSPI
ncbi:hypothetical protein KCU73_g18, partial [Aureobasidium melanogenum]